METYFKYMKDALNKLSEKHPVLKEAYSSSMPSWLKDRITRTKKPKPYSWKLGNPEYITPRGSNEEGWELGLFNQFLKQGIDLNSVEVISAPKPTKSSDPLLADPYIPIFLFDNGQVYAKGINDNEKFDLDPNYAPFKYLSNKRLLDLATDFCYIDRSKIDPNVLRTKQEDRRALQKELKDLINYRDPNAYGTDKSGYRSNSERYKQKLRELKASRITDIMQEAEDEIEDSRAIFASFILNDDLQEVADAVYGLGEKFKDLVRAYSNARAEVDQILNDTSMSDEERTSYLSGLFNTGYYGGAVTRLQRAIKNFKAQSARYKSVVLDW